MDVFFLDQQMYWIWNMEYVFFHFQTFFFKVQLKKNVLNESSFVKGVENLTSAPLQGPWTDRYKYKWPKINE